MLISTLCAINKKIANVEAEADSSEDEVDEDVNLPTETENGEQFTSDFVLHNTNPPETATYLSQNMIKPKVDIHQSVIFNNPIGIFILSPVSHTPYAGHYIPPVRNNLLPQPVSHNPYATP